MELFLKLVDLFNKNNVKVAENYNKWNLMKNIYYLDSLVDSDE